ncbi:adenylate/guanylate cyclase domain-containing protein [Caballeronia sordidicola]|uniref:adenylate/guanylate cyclase domain-containing protein n=1 Tax=Caballeronia sordidicola TaxID=196367 RepID=UPI0004CFEEF4|nr:adenylate/guanylate cyclase domain-containing protein [Caballeronia sordidicola]
MADDLTKWLVQVGLGGHAATFASQGIDWDVLGDLSEQDLRELGLPLGDRKRLLKALAALTDARTPSRKRELEPQEQPPASAAGALEAERRQLTVMFVDLVDSTPLAERFDPEDMRRVLGVFHQACASAIEAHEGHIAQYIGDGLLVYFGYPHAHEDDAVRAVLAGLAVISALHQANDRIEAEDGVRLHVRIGIETGLVIAGEIGAGSSLDHHAVVGESPIVAARLQSLAPPDAIVVGPATERLIEGSFLLESLGWRELKGVSGPVHVHRVLVQTDAVDRFEIRAAHGMTPLIGRTAELDMLRQRWKQGADGEMRCVLLIGEPGIGKSRMLRALRDSISADAHEVVSFHCSSYYRDSPFWPVLQRLQRAFGLDPKALTASDVERLETGLGTLGVDIEETILVLTTLLGIPTAQRYPGIDASSPSFKRRTLEVLVAMIEKMTHLQPVLVIVEDVHWIDPSSLEFVRLMLEQLVADRLLVLLTARPEFKPGWTYPHLVQVNLDRLSRRDCIAMIERLTDGKLLPRLVLEQIVGKTDGVPLFVEELTKAVLQGELLHDAGRSYELKRAPHAIAIPDTLQGSLLSRLDRLEPGVKETAQIAATVGREFGRRLLALIASKPENELQGTLDRLIAAEIILPASGAPADGGAYVFRHALIQEIAYQSLLLARRRQYHGLIAAALEQYYPEIVERQPELIAQNLAAADLPDRAINFWQRAGERALACAACEEAIAHAQRGLQSAESLVCGDHYRATRTLPLLLIRGGAEHRLGRRDAIETFRQAAQLARVEKLSSHLVQAALGFDTAETFLADSGEASIALLEEALASIGSGETVERSRLLSRLVRTLHMTGAFQRGGEIAGQAVALARRLGDRPSLFDSLACELMHVGARHIPASKFPERQGVLEELIRIAEELDDAHSIGHACARRLTGYLEIGDVERFEEALERYQQVAVSGQHFVDKWCVTGAQAMQAILVGDFALAERKAQESLEMAESVDAKFAAGVYGMQMFTIRREQGRLAEVAPLLKRFVDEHSQNATWRPGLMLVASDLGFEAQARHYLDHLAESESDIPVDSMRLVTLTYLAEVATRLRETGHAERIYAFLLPFRDQVVTVPAVTLCCGSAARYLGMLASALGDWTAAEEHFEYALRMDERLRAWPWLAHSQHEFALMLSARDRNGDRARAAVLLASAAATAKELKMFALLERIGGTAGSSGPRN